jgi:hypothetical protein
MLGDPGTFTFAWVAEDQTTFDPNTMAVLDEDVFSFEVDHDEGQIPALHLVVRNPRIGLLAPGRNVWAWLGWYNDETGHLEPLFFGVLVGVPTSLFKEMVTLQFIARSPRFIADKQHVAETMRAPPYYDPIWLEVGKRDDPDSILEGWSALWHIDRKSMVITASDILVGEDGTETFTEDDGFYDSVSLSLGQAPLTNIRVEATVNWTQRTSGFVTVPTVSLSSYTGESLLGDWPKPGGNIGGGYKCETSFVTDVYRVSQTPQTSYQYNWTNTDPNPGQCSNATASSQSSGPALLSPNPISAVLTGLYKTGVCDPFSDPPINTPATTSSTGVIVPQWSVGLDMTMRYDASRQFSEILSFDMTANTQGILASPTVAQNTELLSLSSVDVSQPLVFVEAWTDFASQPVGIAQIIFPNNPTTPGGLSYQICVSAGVAGATEPIFSDVQGFTTNDGSVIWASLGGQSLTTAPKWSLGTYAPLGQIILLQDQAFHNAAGDFEDIPGRTTYYICTKAGVTNGVYTDFSYVPPPTSNIAPVSAVRHISYVTPPTFSTTVGQQINDGTVVWTVLGHTPANLGIPIGGSVDDVQARCFFPLARGIISVEYLISRARARLRLRSRAVKVGWECRFSKAVNLSCRKNATLFDPRFPGGAATGKVISYKLIANGDGKILGKVEIGCAVGFGDSIVEITGEPVYAAAGYAEFGWQQYAGSMEAHGSNETTFSRPVFTGFDDGLVFPLRWEDISDGGRISGTLAEQKAAILQSFNTTILLEFLNRWGIQDSIVPPGGLTTTQKSLDATQAWHLEDQQLALASQNTPYVMAANPISWSCLLKPCAGNGPFGGSYAIEVSPLTVPQGINLEAPSSP